MLDLPTGTVTFLFTDIEGSTRLLTELGDSYSEVLGEHRRVIREAIALHGGVEVDTRGDAFFAAFQRATDAVAAAAAGQRALASGPARVRMGVHTGEPIVRNGEYIGMDVHRAARIAAVGHGGQVLVSQTTRELLDDPSELRDLGEFRLKDLSGPQRLHQLGTAVFPPLKTLSRTNLPSQATELVGRQRELEAAATLLREKWLVTLLGPGGVGKTRLALQLAAEVADDFADGVFWVPLDSLEDWQLVLPTVAQTLGAHGDLQEHLRPMELLLLLDGFDRVSEAAAPLVDLLVTAPEVKLLVTSRAPLRVAGEQEYPVLPLPEADAIALFSERAREVRPGFVPSAAVTEICRRLEGLPLALELAAARAKVLPSSGILARLERRLPLLTGGALDVPERQRTMRATIEWSHNLLGEEERRLFADLAVFAGGFTVEAAEEVCAAGLDTLTSLVDKSLLRNDGVRFQMLETIREYAHERLEASEDVPELHRRHAGFYGRLAEIARPHLRGPQRDWLDRVEAEHDNFRSVLAWSLDDGDLELGFGIAESLVAFWHLRANHLEGLRWLAKALARADEVLAATTRASGLHSLGSLLFFEGEFKRAEEAFEESLSLYRAAGDQPRIADVINSLGNATWALGDRKRTRKLREEALALCWELRDAYGVARTLHYIGEESRDSGDLAGARRAFEESIDVMSELGDKSFVMASLHGLGDLELDARNCSVATERYRECLVLALELEIRRFVVYALAGLASTAAVAGDSARAGRLWGVVESMEEQPGPRILSFERQRYEVAMEEHVPDPVFRAAVAEGRGLSKDDAVREALTLLD